jgi:hypothetical protein
MVGSELVSLGSSQSGTTNASNLNHGRDISLDICKLSLFHCVEAEEMLKVLLAERSRDQTFVDSWAAC